MKIKLLAFALMCLGVFEANSQEIVINEVLASNTTVNTDLDGDYQDWIELRNNSGISVNLNGFGLTDDATLPYKWTFPNVTMAPNSYLIVFCSDKDLTDPFGELHTNFKISASGETLTLTNTSGVALNTVTLPALGENISYGRLPNGTGNFMFFTAVTAGAANGGTAFSEILPEAVFSQDSGFFTTGFTLTLSTDVPGASIIYTLDGSEPDAGNLSGTTYTYKNQYPELPGQATGPLLNQSFTTLSYSAPLSIVDRTSQPNEISTISSTMHFDPYYIPENNIFKGTVVRAKVVKPGALAGPTVTKNYFVSPLGNDRFSLPVVSISISENKLYDYNEGIYVAGVDFDEWRAANPTLDHNGIENIANFYRRGIEHERTGNFSYFVDGNEVINQEVGFRIHGGSSREWQNKSFNIYAREEYGDSDMDYAFFPNQPTDFERLILRNSGADFYETLFRDAFCQRLMKNLNVITKGYQPTITFMNGEYWGILSLSDKFDNNYFSRVYDIASDEIDIMSSQSSVEEGDNVHYFAMRNFMQNNSLAVPANYDYVTTQMDPESFADYFISNIFLQNIDWPGNNIVYWRKKTAAFVPNAPFGHDGRWRWLAHDMDATFATRSHNIALNSLAAATAVGGPSWPNPEWSTFLLRKMLENDMFKNHFINRFADLLNTTYLTDRVIAIQNEMKAQIEPEINEQIARWSAPSLFDWNSYLGEQIDFAEQRPAFQRDHIRTKFDIASNINATLDVSDAAHGFIKINTIEIKEGTDGISAMPYPWTGIYFSNIPVTLKAVANEGYMFSHWTGASTGTNEEITITTANAFSVTAVFVPDTTPAASEPIYFWMMDDSMPNNLPLETLSSTFEAEGVDGVINYTSSLVGYPFTSASPFWRKASMERRNSPTDINYIPEANNNIPFATSEMRGLQIKEPLQSGSNSNTMVFNFSTDGYKDIKFSFAAINELTNATGILIDYATNAGTPSWTTAGLPSSTLPLSGTYQLYDVNMSSITAANDNPNFKVRLRFTGTGDMAVDNGNRITFNNIAVRGTEIQLSTPENQSAHFNVYPNPVADQLNISGLDGQSAYRIFTIEGKLVQSGAILSNSLNVSSLSKGMYLVEITSGERTETKKIIKR